MDDLEVVGEVGRGSHGKVLLVRRVGSSQTKLVLKCVELQGCGPGAVESARQEVSILASLRHPNIVSYKGSFERDGRLHVLLGYCSGGDLHRRIIHQRGSPFPETKVARWFIQITMALQYLHSHNILHRDLKTHNILLTKNGLVKVADFGISRVLSSPRDLATTLVGTPYYMSPELLGSRPYNHKSDMWALGCVLFELATLRPPFPAQDLPSLIYRVSRGKLGVLPSQYSDSLRALVTALLTRHPEHRPSASRVLQLPYIRTHMSLFLQDTEGEPHFPGTPAEEDCTVVWDGLKERAGQMEMDGRELDDNVQYEDEEELNELYQSYDEFKEDGSQVLDSEPADENEITIAPRYMVDVNNLKKNLDSLSVISEEVQIPSDSHRHSDGSIDLQNDDDVGDEMSCKSNSEENIRSTQNIIKRCCDFMPAEFGALHITGGRMKLGERTKVEPQRSTGEKECRCPRKRHQSAGHVGSVSRVRRRNDKEKTDDYKRRNDRGKNENLNAVREVTPNWVPTAGGCGAKLEVQGNRKGKLQWETALKREVEENAGLIENNYVNCTHLSSSARERRRQKKQEEEGSYEDGSLRERNADLEEGSPRENVDSETCAYVCEDEEEKECFVDLLNSTLTHMSSRQEEQEEVEKKDEKQEEGIKIDLETLELKITELEETLAKEVGQERARSVMEVLKGEEEEVEEDLNSIPSWGTSQDDNHANRANRDDGRSHHGDYRENGECEEPDHASFEEYNNVRLAKDNSTENDSTESVTKAVIEIQYESDPNQIVQASISDNREMALTPQATNTVWQLALYYSIRDGV